MTQGTGWRFHCRHADVAPKTAKSANSAPTISWKSWRAARQRTGNVTLADFLSAGNNPEAMDEL